VNSSRHIRALQIVAAIAAFCCCLPVDWAPASHDGVEIEYAYPGLPEEKAVYRALIECFEQQHPGIRVKEVNPTAGLDILQKLQIQMAGRVPPDVCWLDIGSVYQFAYQGALTPLTGFMEAEGYDLSDFSPPQFLDAARVGGQLYGLPRELNCCLTFYNKTFFADRGVSTPEELVQAGKWTWETFREIGRSLTDLSAKKYSHNVDLHHPWTLSPIMESYGEQLVDLRGNRCNLDSPLCISVLEMLKAFTHTDHIRPQSGEVAAMGDMFMSGQVAMFFAGRWMVPLYSKIDSFEWGIAPLPAGPKGFRTPLVGAFHCIPTHAKHPREAWELVKFLSGPDGQRISAEKGLIIPVRRSVASSDAYLKYPALDEKYNRLFINEIEKHGVLLPIDEHWGALGETVYSGLQRAFANKESVANAVRRVTADVESLLRESD
jgi:multiple sugar transport system substrate-binding protein